MYYYQCKKCNFISKQKNDMKRHLEKQKKCSNTNNNNKPENELFEDSLIKHEIDKELKLMIKENKKTTEGNEKEKCICQKCNKIFHNKSNLNKHVKNNICEKKNVYEEKIIQQINNIQNNNTINININSLRGFDEDWNISYLTKDMREKLLLSDKKFTNTLENILRNDENLNVILKDKMTGLVYKIKNNEYEAMPVKEIFEEAMDKIYKHLRSFFKEIISNNINDVRIDILENEIKEVDKKYDRYKKSTIINNDVNNCLSNIFDEKKNYAIEKLMDVIKDEDKLLEFDEYIDSKDY